MAVVAQFGRNRQTVGNDDQRHGNIKEFAEVVIQLARFEALEIFGFGNADDLDLIGMDKIQMADQRQTGLSASTPMRLSAPELPAAQASWSLC